jgi:hypothetical protein
MPLSQLQQKWWQWTAVVEHILQLRRRAKISPETFKSLQQEILGAAQAGQRVANTERRAFFERLGALVEPWLDLRCLVELEHEIHCCLLSYCLDAGKEIDAWLRAERSEAGSSETVVTDVPDGFKSQKEWRAFRLRMRKFFGADL